MNIVIFSDAYLPKVDGIAISIDHFTRMLGGRGHNFVICAPKYGEGDFDRIGDNIHVVRFNNAGLPSYPDVKIVLPSRNKIAKAMTIFKPDLVHIQTPGLLGQYGILAAKMYGVPLIGTYHTLVSEQETYVSPYRLLKLDKLLDYFKSSKKVKKRLDKVERAPGDNLRKKIILNLCNSLYETGRLIISPSSRIRTVLQEEGVKTPIEVISNGMDLDRFNSQVREAPGDEPRLLHLGRLSYEKNADVILRAFSLILEKKPGARLDIVGDGPALTSLKIEAGQLGLLDRMSFPGFVNYAELPELYRKYDLFMTASTMETQGLVVLEAAACGVPSVGVDAFALPELIQHGRNGFIAEPYDHVAMAEFALKLLEDGELYKVYSRECLAIAREHELSVCADKLEATYRKASGVRS